MADALPFERARSLPVETVMKMCDFIAELKINTRQKVADKISEM